MGVIVGDARAPGVCSPFGILEVRATLVGELPVRPDRNSACGEFERWFHHERQAVFRCG